MSLARCGPKVCVRETWEANLEDMQAGAASLRPENQNRIRTTCLLILLLSNTRETHTLNAAYTVALEFPFHWDFSDVCLSIYRTIMRSLFS